MRQQYTHGIAAFLCGAAVMVLEMTGSRMLAPYLGTSIIVWTSLIGIVLAALSFGYWYGGILADRYPSASVLSKLIFAAAVVIAVVGGSYTFVLQPLSSGKLNLYIASLVSATILFAVPGALLGMVSPFLARLAIGDVESSGRAVGRLYAISSIGSILGTFLGGFVLVSVLKTGTILFLIAAVLVSVAFMLRTVKQKFPDLGGTVVAVLLCVLSGAWYQTFGDGLLPEGIHYETPYNHIRVFDTYQGRIRAYQTDPGEYSQTNIIVGRPETLLCRYAKYADLLFLYNPNARHVAVLGGGGYCLPNYFLATRPNIDIDVVEIDPGVTEIAKKHFGLVDDQRLHIFHEDARRFLRRTRTSNDYKYDLIFSDAFNASYNVPFHLLTKECLTEISDRLDDDGIFMVNIIASATGPRKQFFQAFHRTASEVFPHVDAYMIDDHQQGKSFQNIVFVAFKRDDIPAIDDPSASYADLLRRRWTQPVPHDVPPFLDALAPVEWYTIGER